MAWAAVFHENEQPHRAGGVAQKKTVIKLDGFVKLDDLMCKFRFRLSFCLGMGIHGDHHSQSDAGRLGAVASLPQDLATFKTVWIAVKSICNFTPALG